MALQSMKKTRTRWIGLGLSCLVLVACVSAKINVVDERTALENQILGSYEELDKDLQMVASVRAVDPDGQSKPVPSFHEIRQRAIEARQTQQFNRDDIDELKKAGCLGEGSDGLLKARDCADQAKPEVAGRIQRMLKSENECRGVLLDFVVTTSPDLTREDLPSVQKAYARMNREAAAPGHWVQGDDGKWAQKP